MYIKIHVSVQTIFMGNSNALFKMAESLYTEETIIFSMFFFVRIK